MRARWLVLSTVVPLFLVAGCNGVKQPMADQEAPQQASSLAKAGGAQTVPGQYIIVFQDYVTDVPRVAADLARANNATIAHNYEHTIKGFAAMMSEQAAARLAQNPNVKYIEPDQVVTLGPIETQGKPGGGTSQPPQSTPWGITRVGGAGNGVGKTAWIIDTGIDLNHPDLTVDVNRSRTFVSFGKDSRNAEDGNGHGTHVAGTIAAKNNSIGVVGVAAGATVVAVKVLNSQGSGSYADVIAGVDYVGANGQTGDVANMSLGGGISSALDAAVVAASANVKFALAAGNSADNADNFSPARVNGSNIRTVSAMGQNDLWAYFSNYGNPPVDYCAPGVSILSTWKGDGYNTISGTSMATPHVAGILLLGNINSDGTVNGDPDGNADPIAHR